MRWLARIFANVTYRKKNKTKKTKRFIVLAHTVGEVLPAKADVPKVGQTVTKCRTDALKNRLLPTIGNFVTDINSEANFYLDQVRWKSMVPSAACEIF